MKLHKRTKGVAREPTMIPCSSSYNPYAHPPPHPPPFPTPNTAPRSPPPHRAPFPHPNTNPHLRRPSSSSAIHPFPTPTEPYPYPPFPSPHAAAAPPHPRPYHRASEPTLGPAAYARPPAPPPLPRHAHSDPAYFPARAHPAPGPAPHPPANMAGVGVAAARRQSLMAMHHPPALQAGYHPSFDKRLSLPPEPPPPPPSPGGPSVFPNPHDPRYVRSPTSPGADPDPELARALAESEKTFEADLVRRETQRRAADQEARALAEVRERECEAERERERREREEEKAVVEVALAESLRDEEERRRRVAGGGEMRATAPLKLQLPVGVQQQPQQQQQQPQPQQQKKHHAHPPRVAADMSTLPPPPSYEQAASPTGSAGAEDAFADSFARGLALSPVSSSDGSHAHSHAPPMSRHSHSYSHSTPSSPTSSTSAPRRPMQKSPSMPLSVLPGAHALKASPSQAYQMRSGPAAGAGAGTLGTMREEQEVEGGAHDTGGEEWRKRGIRYLLHPVSSPPLASPSTSSQPSFPQMLLLSSDHAFTIRAPSLSSLLRFLAHNGNVRVEATSSTFALVPHKGSRRSEIELGLDVRLGARKHGPDRTFRSGAVSFHEIAVTLHIPHPTLPLPPPQPSSTTPHFRLTPPPSTSPTYLSLPPSDYAAPLPLPATLAAIALHISAAHTSSARASDRPARAFAKAVEKMPVDAEGAVGIGVVRVGSEGADGGRGVGRRVVGRLIDAVGREREDSGRRGRGEQGEEVFGLITPFTLEPGRSYS